MELDVERAWSPLFEIFHYLILLFFFFFRREIFTTEYGTRELFQIYK